MLHSMYRRGSAGPVCAIIMLLLLAACEGAGGPTPVPPTPSPPPAALAGPRFTVEATGCPWDLAAARATTTGMTVRCGYVAVPEHHSQAAGPAIRLAVLVGQHDPAHPTADALIYLEGGPGARSHATDLGEFGATGRDVIVFDQRGVGYSVPALNCPPLGNRDPLSAALDSQSDLTSCRDEVVKEGVHLDAYNIPEDAADVDSIRQALGYAQLDLYGVSYGTKVALAVLRDFPQTVRSAILDSVLPMQAGVVADLPANIERALNLTFAACAADAACNAAYPNLQQVYFGVVAQLDAHPVALQVNSTPFQLTGARLTSLLLALLISGPEQLPRLVYSLKNGDYGLLGQYLSGEQAPGTDDAWVMTFAVVCSDGHYGTPQEVATAAAPVAAALRGPLAAGAAAIVGLCDGWPVPRVAPVGRQAVRSDVPTLILEGAFDPITPPAYGQLAAQTLRHSVYVEFPDRGHGVRRDSCARQLVAGFLAQPAAAPDTSCVAGRRPNFGAGGQKGTGGGQFDLSRDDVLAAVAPTLHLTVAQLAQLTGAGQSLADVAQAQHVPVQQVKDALLVRIQTLLATAVQQGTLNQAGAAQLYRKFAAGGVDPLLDGK